LDLSEMVGERAVARRLFDQGVDIEELKLDSLDEPLVYDLFGVDEHIGGLGGGHYRAYTSNHLTNKWYHFDDTYVTTAQASDSVNANAYLLFYRRRSNSPLGGKSFHKIEEAKQQPSNAEVNESPAMTIDTHLPTPPNEPTSNGMSTSIAPHFPLHSDVDQEQWNLRSIAVSSLPSPPADDPIDAQDYSQDDLLRATQHYDLYTSNKASPTSSNEADADLDEVILDWGSSPDHFEDEVKDALPEDRSSDWDTVSTLASSSYSDFSDINNASSNVNTRKIEDITLKPLYEKTA